MSVGSATAAVIWFATTSAAVVWVADAVADAVPGEDAVYFMNTLYEVPGTIAKPAAVAVTVFVPVLPLTVVKVLSAPALPVTVPPDE